MHAKQEAPIKNNRSIINHEYMTSDKQSIIAIYCHDNSRTIYIESAYQEKRTLTKYQILFPKGKLSCNVASDWAMTTPNLTTQTAAEIRELSNKSDTLEEIQVTNQEMQAFKSIIDKAAKNECVVNGDQDYDICQGLNAIGRNITFNKPSDGGCVLC